MSILPTETPETAALKKAVDTFRKRLVTFKAAAELFLSMVDKNQRSQA